MKKISGIFLVFILTLGALTLVACSSSSSSLKMGDTAPDFKLPDLNGQSVSLGSFKGKTVLLNFWATTCNPCVNEMPYFQAMHEEMSANSNFVLLMIDVGEDAATVKKFIQGNKYTFTVLLDNQYEVAGKYNVQYTPTSVLIGKEGKVEFSIIGAFKDKAAIEKQISSYLN